MDLAHGVQLVSFGILAAIAIVAALGVVLLQNIVYSAFLLGGVFASMAGMYLLLNGDFVAAAQLIIYVGAVNVLILFGIMLVNKQQDFPAIKGMWIRKGATALVGAGLLVLLAGTIVTTPWSISTATPTGDGSTLKIGEHFFSDFLLPFELASVLLLIAMVGAIVLARREFVPEDTPTTEEELAFKLPERPRETAAIAGGSQTSPE